MFHIERIVSTRRVFSFAVFVARLRPLHHPRALRRDHPDLSHIIERPQIQVRGNDLASPRKINEEPKSISRDWAEKLLAELRRMGPRMFSIWSTQFSLWKRESEAVEASNWEYYKREFMSHRADHEGRGLIGEEIKWEVWAGITDLKRNTMYHAIAEEEQDEAYPRFLYGRRVVSLKAANGDAF